MGPFVGEGSRMQGSGEGESFQALSGDALRVVTRLLVGARELERRFDACLAAHHLNVTRADLGCVALHGEQGCAQIDLAESLRLSESNICTLVERMRADGWVERLRSGVDRRRSVIVLTPQARASLEHLQTLRQNRASQWLRSLTATEIQQFNDLLDRLLASLRDERTLPAPSEASVSTSSPNPSEMYRRAS
jgi:DNA-binding MarR family transcriptional regulator